MSKSARNCIYYYSRYGGSIAYCCKSLIVSFMVISVKYCLIGIQHKFLVAIAISSTSICCASSFSIGLMSLVTTKQYKGLCHCKDIWWHTIIGWFLLSNCTLPWKDTYYTVLYKITRIYLITYMFYSKLANILLFCTANH
jgi:hypothetical protein